MKKTLPKTAGELTNGGVYRQQVKCGKPNCRCRVPGESHVAFYFIARSGGRQYKRYLRQSDVDAMSRLVQTSRELRSTRRQIVLENKTKLQQFSEFLRNIDAD